MKKFKTCTTVCYEGDLEDYLNSKYFLEQLEGYSIVTIISNAGPTDAKFFFTVVLQRKELTNA